MRNFASAAHPNQHQLTGLQLIQWMDTCIREVLAKEPLTPAIEAQILLRNLREKELDTDSSRPINQAISALEDVLLAPLLRTIFGMYVDPDLPAKARSNIRLVQQTIWQGSADNARYEVGLKYSSFRAHGEADRASLAREFIFAVDGLTYLPESDLELELTGALDSLLIAHNGWDNFYSEPPMAREVERLVPDSGIVPGGIRARYVEVITMCKLTNGRGIAWNAESTYDRLIRAWQDREILEFLVLLGNIDVKSRLQFVLCNSKLYDMAAVMANNTSNSLALEGLNSVVDRVPERAGQAVLESRFLRIIERIKGVI